MRIIFLELMLYLKIAIFSGTPANICGILNGTQPWFDESIDDWTEEVIERANRNLVSFLKPLVDQWIDSGRDINNWNCHTIADRSLRRVPSGYKTPLLEVLSPYWKRVRPDVCLLLDGTWAVPTGPGHLGGNPSKTRLLAFYFFSQMLQTPGRAILRCDNPECGRYFQYERIPKVPIKLGTYCSNCKGRAAAIRLRESRRRRQQCLEQLAAKIWHLYPEVSKIRRPAWVAQEMNKTLPPSQQLNEKGKWVTQNKALFLCEVDKDRPHRNKKA